MSKEAKISIGAIMTVALLSFFLIFLNSNLVQLGRTGIESRQPKKVDLAKLERDYKTDTKRIMDTYLQTGNLDEQQVNTTKTQLMGLVVPAKFKDLHYSLVFAMDRMADYIKNGDNQKKIASQELITQALEKYTWLN